MTTAPHLPRCHRPMSRRPMSRATSPRERWVPRRVGSCRWVGGRADGVSRPRRRRSGRYEAQQRRQPLLHAEYQPCCHSESRRRPGHSVHRQSYRPRHEHGVGDRRSGHRLVPVRRAAPGLRGSWEPEFQLVDHRVSRGQCHHPRVASRQLPRLRQRRSERHRLQRLVVADDRPPLNTAINVAGGAGDYPTASGQTFAEVGQGGQQPGQFNGISVNCLPSEPCTLALAIWTENVKVPGQTSVYFVGVPVTFQTSSADLACNGPAPGQVASESPDRLGETVTEWDIDACKSGLAGGQALTLQSRFEQQRRPGTVRVRRRIRRSGLQRGRLRPARVGLLAVELPGWRPTGSVRTSRYPLR